MKLKTIKHQYSDRLIYLSVTLLCFFSPLSFGHHHGTRCPLDFQANADWLVKVANSKGAKETPQSLLEAGKSNLRAVIKLGKNRFGYNKDPAKSVPSVGDAYSAPLVFAPCLVKLPENKTCPALTWCYPYKENTQTLACTEPPLIPGNPKVALTCENERSRCSKSPHLPECVQPPAAAEKCYANPPNTVAGKLSPQCEKIYNQTIKDLKRVKPLERTSLIQK